MRAGMGWETLEESGDDRPEQGTSPEAATCVTRGTASMCGGQAVGVEEFQGHVQSGPRVLRVQSTEDHRHEEAGAQGPHPYRY